MGKTILAFILDVFIVLFLSLLIVGLAQQLGLLGMPASLLAGRNENGQFIVEGTEMMQKLRIWYASIWLGTSVLVGFGYVLAGILAWGTTPARRYLLGKPKAF